MYVYVWREGFTKCGFVASKQPDVEDEQKRKGDGKHGRNQRQKQNMQFNTTIKQLALKEKETGILCKSQILSKTKIRF